MESEPAVIDPFTIIGILTVVALGCVFVVIMVVVVAVLVTLYEYIKVMARGDRE